MALGIPSIAMSQAMRIFHDGEKALYETAEAYGPAIVKRLMEAGWPAGEVVMNVNFPDVAADAVSAVEVTRQGRRDFKHMMAERRTDLRGRDYYWMGFKGQLSNPPAGTDLRAIYDGKISVTPLHIDLTHGETVNRLKGVLGGAPPKLG